MRQLFGAKLAARMLPLDSERGAAARRLRPCHDQPGLLRDAADGLHFRQRPRGARSRARSARSRRPIETLMPRGRYPAVVAVPRAAARRRRRQRSSDEDRGALSQFGRGVRGGLSCACAPARRPDRPASDDRSRRPQTRRRLEQPRRRLPLRTVSDGARALRLDARRAGARTLPSNAPLRLARRVLTAVDRSRPQPRALAPAAVSDRGAQDARQSSR